MSGRRRSVVVTDVEPGADSYEAVLTLADAVLEQRRYLVASMSHALHSVLLGAFDDGRCVGFLRYLVQVIGAEEGRPPILDSRGIALTEGFVEAFGVDPAERRRGIGSSLQAEARRRCAGAGCYQMRSRSPVTSVENYAMKIASGYLVQPSRENDSYYFISKL